MTGLELLLTALVAGAAAGVGKTATQAVSDSYEALKRLVVGKLKGRDKAAAAIASGPTDKELLRREAAADLTATGADEDAEVQEAVRDLLEQLDRHGGTYQFLGGDYKGNQFGSGNSMTIYFGDEPGPHGRRA